MLLIVPSVLTMPSLPVLGFGSCQGCLCSLLCDYTLHTSPWCLSLICNVSTTKFSPTPLGIHFLHFSFTSFPWLKSAFLSPFSHFGISYMLISGRLCLMVNLFSNFRGLSILYSIVVILAYIFTKTGSGYFFLHIITTIYSA